MSSPNGRFGSFLDPPPQPDLYHVQLEASMVSHSDQEARKRLAHWLLEGGDGVNVWLNIRKSSDTPGP